MSGQTLIGPGLVLPGHGRAPVEDGGVLVEGGLVREVGEHVELARRHPYAQRLNAGGMAIMPGFINAHGHLYGILARGIALKDAPPETFQQVLERLWWRLDKALDDEAVYLSAVLGLIGCIRAGTTTLIDHHASPNAIPGSLDRIAAACAEVGVRACLCYEVSDRDGPERARAGIEENVRFLERTALRRGRAGTVAGDGGAAAEAASTGELLAARFGLHASLTLSDATLAECRRAAEAFDTGFHIHAAEGPEDGADSRQRYGKPVIHRLAERGILGPRSIVAHCVHVDDGEIELLARTATTVTHQPHSNMGNAVGFAPSVRMMERGVRVCLGTDGYVWDMIETHRAAATLHSHATRVPGAGGGEFGRALLRNNAELATSVFGRPLGVLEPGAFADVIIVDYRPPTALSADNLPWHIQFGMSGGSVDTVMVQGRVVMRHRRLAGVDEEAVAAAARRVSRAVWERF